MNDFNRIYYSSCATDETTRMLRFYFFQMQIWNFNWKFWMSFRSYSNLNPTKMMMKEHGSVLYKNGKEKVSIVLLLLASIDTMN